MPEEVLKPTIVTTPAAEAEAQGQSLHLAPLPATAIAPVDHRISLTQSDLDVAKETYAKDCNDAEFRLFISVAQDRGLDPRAGQIHAIVRSKDNAKFRKLTIQTSIDGYRLIAQRTGEYIGQDPKLWLDKEGKWVDVWLDDSPPRAAKATIYRQGHVVPTVAVATWAEYAVYKDEYQGNNKTGNKVLTDMWANRGAGQLAKCAEALAFRMAFPEDLSGLYTDDEMDQAAMRENAITTTALPANSGAGGPSKPASYNADQQALKVRTGELSEEERETFITWWESCNYPKLSNAPAAVLKIGNKKVDEIIGARDSGRPFEASTEVEKTEETLVDNSEAVDAKLATYSVSDYIKPLNNKQREVLAAWMVTEGLDDPNAVPSDRIPAVQEAIAKLQAGELDL